MNDHSEPTFENQLWHAERVLKEQGLKELHRHADIGRMCRCGDCFCCAALQVENESYPPRRQPWKQ